MKSSKMTETQMAARIAELEQQVAKNHAISFKVSGKGAVSVYGLNARFPVTLYGDQWQKLLALKDELLKFIAEHKSELSMKKGNHA